MVASVQSEYSWEHLYVYPGMKCCWCCFWFQSLDVESSVTQTSNALKYRSKMVIRYIKRKKKFCCIYSFCFEVNTKGKILFWTYKFQILKPCFYSIVISNCKLLISNVKLSFKLNFKFIVRYGNGGFNYRIFDSFKNGHFIPNRKCIHNLSSSIKWMQWQLID